MPPITGGLSPYAWWFLSSKQKKALETERRGGRFGGETAKAVSQAPYYWAQEYGEPLAAIKGQGYVGDAFSRWRARAGNILSDHFKGR